MMAPVESTALSDQIVAARPLLTEVVEHLEEVLRMVLAPRARRRLLQALALLHATGDVLDEASLIERLSQAT